jgi:hypothetical protein
MYAIEFQTIVRDGAIDIPAEHRARFQHRVKVILMAEEESNSTATLIDRLLASPRRVHDFQPLTREEIYGR